MSRSAQHGICGDSTTHADGALGRSRRGYEIRKPSQDLVFEREIGLGEVALFQITAICRFKARFEIGGLVCQHSLCFRHNLGDAGNDEILTEIELLASE